MRFCVHLCIVFVSVFLYIFFVAFVFQHGIQGGGERKRPSPAAAREHRLDLNHLVTRISGEILQLQRLICQSLRDDLSARPPCGVDRRVQGHSRRPRGHSKSGTP
eukprot:CAMPEP_0168454052 /NCGR_PEP_ID=MMETSP0228-20121227/50014_1 /TAXON_ID=133427 /ORGANISM="Protoceratium reticulatum, Strain CCCM 535 (=CCMP 1889)" /LENGTH=104 /DNA_ID=CAMNT_0008468811 /DNA_START=229 /DNA_END=540 /DNA_ORIENTATION=-